MEKEVMLIAKRLGEQGEYEEALKLIENKLESTQDLSDIRPLILTYIDISLEDASSSFSAGVYKSSMQSLSNALSLLSRERFSSYKNHIDWKLLRVKLLSRLGERQQEHEEYAGILKELLSIYTALPKDFEILKEIERTESELGITLTKARQFHEAEKYTNRSVLALERQLKLSKSIPAHLSVCPPHISKRKFRMLMIDLCLAHHQLGVLRKQLKNYKLASISIEKAYLLSLKYLKDTPEAKIITRDYNESFCKKSSRIVITEKFQIDQKTARTTEKPKQNEILGTVYTNKATEKQGKKLVPKPPREEMKEPSIKRVATLFKLIRRNIVPEQFSSSRTEKIEAVENQFVQRNQLINETKSHKIEEESAIIIQRAVRKYRSKFDRPDPEEERKQEIERIVEVEREREREREREVVIEVESTSIFYQTQEQRDNICAPSTERQNTDFKQAELLDYLNLDTSHISFRKDLGNLKYLWVLKVTNIQAKLQRLSTTIELIGTTSCFTGTIFEFTELNFDPNECPNEIKKSPFSYSTIWPVIQQFIFQWKLFAGVLYPDNKELPASDKFLNSNKQDMDKEAADKIIGWIRSFLESVDSAKTDIGVKILPQKSITENLNKPNDRTDLYGHLKEPDGVIRHSSQLVGQQYTEGHKISNNKHLERVEENIKEEIIQRGFVRLENAYYIFSISISKNYSQFRPINSVYKTFVYISLKRPGNQWTRETCVTWERFAQVFEDFKCNLNIPFMILTKKIHKDILEIMYEHISDIFKIKDDQLSIVDKLHTGAKLSSISEDDLKTIMAETKSIQTAASLLPEYQEGKISSHSQVFDNEHKINIGRTAIAGSKDRFHLQLTVRPGNSILCVAISCTSNEEYFCILPVNNFTQVLERSPEVFKSIMLVQLKFEISPIGPILVYHPVPERRRSYSEIRKINGKRIHCTLATSSTQWSLTLFNLAEKDLFTINLSLNDLSNFFGIEVPDEVEIKKAIDQLLKNLRIRRSILGNRVYWTVEKDQRAPRVVSPIFDQTSLQQQNIVTPKLLMEQKIDAVLGIPITKLSLCEKQELLVVQKTKIIDDQRCIVSVSRLIPLKEWRIRINILNTCRSYICKLFDSDLLKMSEQASKNAPGDNWNMVILKSQIEYNDQNKLHFRFDDITRPLREIIYSSYICKNKVTSLYEVLLDSPFSFNKHFETLKSMEEAKDIRMTIQSYSIEKKDWFESTFSLEKCVMNLVKDKIIDGSILRQTDIKYADIQFFAGILCRLVNFEHKKQTHKQNLVLDTEEEPQIIASGQEHLEHSLSSIYGKDLLLYETVINAVPPCIAGAYYNSPNEQFVIKIYLPRKGLVFRQAFSSDRIFTQVNFSMAMLSNNFKVNLGKRVLQDFYPEATENLRSARLI